MAFRRLSTLKLLSVCIRGNIMFLLIPMTRKTPKLLGEMMVYEV